MPVSLDTLAPRSPGASVDVPARSRPVGRPATAPSAPLPVSRRGEGPSLWLVAFVVYAVSLAVHLWLGLGMRNPIIQPDEGGYLGAAHFLAHGTGLLDVTSQYHPAYSLLLAPFERLFDDPLNVYRAALGLNAVLLAGTSLTALALVRLLLPDAPVSRRVAIAATVGLYPPFLLFSNLAMAESLFIPVFMLTCATAGYACRQERLAPWFAFGLFTGLLYAIDPVGLVVVAAACLLAWRVMWRRVRRRLAGVVVFLLGLQVAVLPGLVLIRHVAGPPATSDATTSGAVTAASAETASRIAVNAQSVLNRFGGWSDVPNLLFELAGQALYLVASTYGLVVVGMVMAGRALKRVVFDGSDAAADYLGSFIGACMLGTWLLSSLRIVSGGEPARADLLVYGRYNENVLGPVLVLGLAGLVTLLGRRRARWPAWVLVTGAVAGVAGAVVALGRPDVLRGPSVGVNVLGIQPLIAHAERVHVPLIVGLTVAVSVGVFFLARVGSVELACIPLMVLFVAWASSSAGELSDGSRSRADRVVVSAAAHVGRTLPDAPPCIGYEAGTGFDWHYYNNQFFLPDVELRQFVPSFGQQPCSNLVLTRGRDVPVRFPGARLVAFENADDQGLWAVPGPFQDALAAAGFLQTGIGGARLPDVACVSDVALVDPLPARRGDGPPSLTIGGRQRVTLAVAHAGAGSPWPNLYGAKADRGAVRLAITWSTPGDPGIPFAQHRGDLPRTVLPGQRVDAEVVLDPVGPDGTPLPAGDYRVSIAPVQEGYLHFTDVGDEPFVLEVTVTR